MDKQKNIRIIFTEKSDSALEELIKKFGLEKNYEQTGKSAITIISPLIKDCAREEISEKNLVNSLKKDLEVSQPTAEQIAKEILENIVPFMVKAPEERFEDSAFREETAKKVFGEEKPVGQVQIKNPAREEKDLDIFPKVAPPAGVVEKKEEIKSKLTVPAKRIKKPTIEETKEKFKEPVTKTVQRSGPDNYREPI